MVNFEKSQPPPASLAIEKLKKKGKYNLPDVLHRLIEDFKNKCYLCEQKAPISINIEHFTPHRREKDLMFNWDNLFWACEHCNKTKGHKRRFDMILNCTNLEHDVVNWIKYRIDPFPMGKVTITAISMSNEYKEIIQNTVNLLLEVYHGTTPQKRIESNNLSQKIEVEISNFTSLLRNYREDQEEEVREYCRRKIIEEVHKSSAFTAFKRWCIKDYEELSRDFEHYFD